MAYFSNGTEGRMYEEQFCNKCVHDPNTCPILALHFLWNYDQNSDKTKELTLDTFIPRSKDGLSNEQCTMFMEKK